MPMYCNNQNRNRYNDWCRLEFFFPYYTVKVFCHDLRMNFAPETAYGLKLISLEYCHIQILLYYGNLCLGLQIRIHTPFKKLILTVFKTCFIFLNLILRFFNAKSVYKVTILHFIHGFIKFFTIHRTNEILTKAKHDLVFVRKLLYCKRYKYFTVNVNLQTF